MKTKILAINPSLKTSSIHDFKKIVPVEYSVDIDSNKSLIKTIMQLSHETGAKGFFIDDLFSLTFSLDCFKDFHNSLDLYFSISASLTRTDNSFTIQHFQNLYDSGVKVINWHAGQEPKKSDHTLLWDCSKAGIWNHIVFSETLNQNQALFSFIKSNPNIAHSYKGIPPKSIIDATLDPYSIVEPVPGKPMWKLLNDPSHLLFYLKKYEKKELFCMRFDEKKNTHFLLGKNLTFYYEKPKDIPAKIFEEILKMVEAGGSVKTDVLRYNLERAFLIAYAMENGVIAGNSSLKHPRSEFIKRINKMTGMDFNHFVERGYTSVRPEYRALGVGAKLLEGLTKRAENYKIFSIISEDNKATQKIAIRNKTKKIATYFSENMGKEASVWMPEHMIDES